MRKGTCIHFNGTINPACEAGVNYRDLIGGPSTGWALKLPCTNGLRKPGYKTISCNQYCEPTKEQIDNFEKDLEEHLKRFNSVMPLIIKMKKDFKGQDGSQTISCPVCGNSLHMSISGYNGHVHGRCESEGCLNWME